MSRAHTLEPWVQSKDAVPLGHTQVTIYSERTGERIATVFINQANVDLIRTAPVLLAACKAAVEEDCGLACIEQLRTAINEAEGDTL